MSKRNRRTKDAPIESIIFVICITLCQYLLLPTVVDQYTEEFTFFSLIRH
jgi:hypothetical protein